MNCSVFYEMSYRISQKHGMINSTLAITKMPPFQRLEDYDQNACKSNCVVNRHRRVIFSTFVWAACVCMRIKFKLEIRLCVRGVVHLQLNKHKVKYITVQIASRGQALLETSEECTTNHQEL